MPYPLALLTLMTQMVSDTLLASLSSINPPRTALSISHDYRIGEGRGISQSPAVGDIAEETAVDSLASKGLAMVFL